MHRLKKFLAAALFLCALSPAQSAPPNILLIFTDDQGWNDVGCYGSEIPTPNIDRIAAEGLKFENFYSASSICTPSRFGLLTGRNPVRSKDQLLSALMFMADEHKNTRLHADETTIAEVLRDKAGYHTALIGKWHLGHGKTDFLPPNRGFDLFRGHTGGCIDFFTMTYGIIPDWYHQTEHVSENGYATELITDEAVEFFQSRKDSEQPFFLYLAYNAPHFGKGYSPKDKAPVNIMQPQAADLIRSGVSTIEDKIRREFAAMTVSLDDGVGRVLESLEATGLEKDTLVIFLTDHGGDPVYGGSNEPLRGVKATLFEGGIKVPCVMRWPGKIKPGRTESGVFWALDLFPTFCALAGADYTSEFLDGNDISPMILDQRPDAAKSPGREFLWETGAHSELGRKRWRALRKGGWKFLSSPKDGEFLFNLAEDPFEKADLKSKQPEKFEELKQRAEELAESYRPGA
ncbi:MAG: sulfatase-like hydrolase/transferase [Verrucomicrobiales bacterium]|nr:sulfatase-like hydrolase/transferase [Verrucomicrobiales bacterium]